MSQSNNTHQLKSDHRDRRITSPLAHSSTSYQNPMDIIMYIEDTPKKNPLTSQSRCATKTMYVHIYKVSLHTYECYMWVPEEFWCWAQPLLLIDRPHLIGCLTLCLNNTSSFAQSSSSSWFFFWYVWNRAISLSFKVFIYARAGENMKEKKEERNARL